MNGSREVSEWMDMSEAKGPERKDPTRGIRAELYTRYTIVARALGLAAFKLRPSARASKGILHTTSGWIRVKGFERSDTSGGI